MGRTPKPLFSALSTVKHARVLSLFIGFLHITPPPTPNPAQLSTALHVWEEHVNKVTSSCFGALSILNKFKNVISQKLKKQVVELLILSKMDYADAVFRPLSLKLQKRLQKVENAAASFVLGRYTKEIDVLSLGWLPMKERRDWHLVKLAFKYISKRNKLAFKYISKRNKPEYTDISQKENRENLRSSSAPLIATSTNYKTLRNNAAELFKKMPIAIRSSKPTAEFSSNPKNISLEKQ